jgi:rubrerythrin
MTWDEYNKLFHKTQANLVAFQPLMQCDHEVIKMIEAAVEAEREACALEAKLKEKNT